ncbi:MAG: hypothetical protein E4G98_06895 [Promethearchaeota archaeon]|nr:MAG: hypothetical protein E4G98_06895 [Candidatus Lokiarchaeota archaeon]
MADPLNVIEVGVLSAIVLVIVGLVALLFTIFLVVDFIKNRKTPHLFIAVAFFVVAAAGFLPVILNDFNSLRSPIVSMLAAFVPGGLATALIYDSVFGEKAKDFAMNYFGYVFLMAIIIVITKAGGCPMTSVMVMMVHIPSGLLIVILPILVSKKDGEKAPLLVSLGGVIISVAGGLLAFLVTGVLPEIEVLIFMLLPWVLLLGAACLALGFLYSSRWTFKFPVLKP